MKWSSLKFLGWVALSLLTVSLHPLIAQGQATFGAEFNFTNQEIRADKNAIYVDSAASEAARDKMMAQVRKTCVECFITELENQYGVKTYRVTYNDGWYFEIATDPAVVEVQTKATTVADLERLEARIQHDIFDAAGAVGLLPASRVMGNWWAGSHIHVGLISSLGVGREAVKKLRNFMVDFSNHAELALGIFSRDIKNAPALMQLPQEEQDRFATIISDVDSGKIQSANTFAKRVRQEVYDVTLLVHDSSTKMQAFNVNRIGVRKFPIEQQTFELRAMRGQESAHDYLILTRLIEARLKLTNNEAPIPVNLPKSIGGYAMGLAFYKYVVETGLDFKPYIKFLPLSLQENSTIESFRMNSGLLSCDYIFE